MGKQAGPERSKASPKCSPSVLGTVPPFPPHEEAAPARPGAASRGRTDGPRRTRGTGNRALRILFPAPSGSAMRHHLLLCPRSLLLLSSRSPLFPDLSPRCSSAFPHQRFSQQREPPVTLSPAPGFSSLALLHPAGFLPSKALSAGCCFSCLQSLCPRVLVLLQPPAASGWRLPFPSPAGRHGSVG